MIWDINHAKEYLEDGVMEARESNEYSQSTKSGLGSGLGDEKRKGQLRALQTGTEKMVKALFLTQGLGINELRRNGQQNPDRTLSLGNFIPLLRRNPLGLDSDDIDVLEEINKINKLKHQIHYLTEEILNVSKTLDKIDGLVRPNLL